ncbi:MAG TPA: GDSL-type esterase/lipase family protein [Terriglobus sp.]
MQHASTGNGGTPVTTSGMWVGAWGASMSNADSVPDNSGGTERSYRFLVTSTIDGTQARVKFSNVYGSTSVTVGAARLSWGKDGSPAIDTTHDVGLTFNGNKSVVLAPGSTVTSDSANISFGLGQVLAVSVYLKGNFNNVSRHDSYFVTNYTTADGAGDTTADAAGSAFTKTMPDWLLVNEVDVYGQYQGTLAMFGSSTTDGYKSDYSADKVYPTPNSPISTQHADRVSDWMARRLAAAGYRIGVLNAGIPGDPITDVGAAPTPNQRFAQDILTLPNLLGIVSYFGSIDLRSSACTNAPEMEAATQQLVAKAAAAKLPLVLTTLPPTALCSNAASPNYGPLPSPGDPYAGGLTPGTPNGSEVQRAAFNQWLRTTGANLAGVVSIADYDLALRDPQHTSFMLPQYNSGDNFHMNGNGYSAEANSISLGFLPR